MGRAMIEVLQSLRAASVDLAEVAEPRSGPGQLLVRSVASVVSADTERLLVEFAGASLLGKGRQQPARVGADPAGQRMCGARCRSRPGPPRPGQAPRRRGGQQRARPGGAAGHFCPDGVDGVIITASTSSSEPVHQGALMCRKRGRIVLVGVTGLELQRKDFYDKELSFQVSCSYGPGRYDASYEDDARDYPLGFVRWTAARNMIAVLDLVAAGRLDLEPLVTHRFALNQAEAAYTALKDDRAALGIVLDYPSRAVPAPPSGILGRFPTVSSVAADTPAATSGVIGVIGAGRFATAVLLPGLVAAGADLRVIASRRGLSASVAAEQFAIPATTTDAREVIVDPNLDAVVILTGHDSHADLVAAALDAGKHVFVEKPLAIDEAGLEMVIPARERYAERTGTEPIVPVGFNRRFAPITERMVALLGRLNGPRAVSITVNTGAIPADHWTQDPLKGGGRIVGEDCRFVDLARSLAGSPIVAVDAAYLGRNPRHDSAVITLRHGDGTMSSIQYPANGSKRYPKERVEVFCDGRVLVNDNFRRLTVFGGAATRPPSVCSRAEVTPSASVPFSPACGLRRRR